MAALDRLYGSSLSLLTDLYQLTMAYGYWKSGVADRQAVFHLFFRRPPFGGGYALACGLETAIEWLDRLHFDEHDTAYLATLTGNDGKPLFEPAFLAYLSGLRLTCDVDGIPEGTVVFPHEPLLRISGPMALCQLLETPLLNIINFQTLVATKAARVCQAARGEPVLEFGLRRAQGIDGGLAASRAAYVGGCSATSNVLAGRHYGIPVKGTHAHSWVMFFDDEVASFEAYAEAMPNNCVFLVDTYDTVEGVRRAVAVGKKLRAQGHEMVGVRLDSGDLAHLSIEARRVLDEGGFPDAAVIASNDLDEHVITSLKQQDAKIGVWGVGTKLVTAYDQPALGGVYKLGAVADPDGGWDYKIKLSEQPIKISNPGVQQVRRYRVDGEIVADTIYDVSQGITSASVMNDIEDPVRKRSIPAGAEHEELLVPIYRGGKRCYDPPTLGEVQQRAAAALTGVSARTRRLLNPQFYPVGLDPSLHALKMKLIANARGEDV